MTGKQYGAWFITDRAEGKYDVRWNVVCKCGNKFTRTTKSFRNRLEYPTNCRDCNKHGAFMKKLNREGQGENKYLLN